MARIVIEVKGGCVTEVSSDEPVEVLVMDHDAGEVGDCCVVENPEFVNKTFLAQEECLAGENQAGG